MRTVLPFNDDWLYWADDVGNSLHDDAFERVTLPHSNKLLPRSSFDSSAYAFVSTYRKRFTLPEPRAGRHVYLDFDGAMTAATVTLNQHTFPEHRGGFVPFSFDLTPYLRDDGENLLTVRLDSSERPDIPPFGYVVDYLTFGGIYRDVWLRYVAPFHLHRITVQPRDVLTAPKLAVQIACAQDEPPTGSLSFSATLRDSAGKVVVMEEEVVQDMNHLRALLTETAFLFDVPGAQLWTPDDPVLYTLDVEVFQDGGPIDARRLRFGFRDAQFRPDGFYLNGAKLNLRGLNRHQTFPYFGAAAPERLQRRDAEIVRYELGCNVVRTSHYPQSPYFLDRCDEIGLLVFEEIPGWQHIGSDEWKALALRDLHAMIDRDAHHPSIILWGVRINESLDDHDFYAATNKLAHDLDPTRQTGGVRFFLQSEFLEDVYTFNDFSNGVVDPDHLPHLITEFSGHMFPTKTWDHEERQVEHALRHARIQNAAAGHPQVAGAIGWCAFDYNTHREFGSGDRVCYHGVMDMFRLPKFAAALYSSQIPPSQRVVLQAASFWTHGDRSEGGNDPLVVFSNCDTLDVYVGDEMYGTFDPDRRTYPHLAHPPFVVTGLTMQTTWGARYRDLRLVGHLNGAPAAEQRIAAGALPHALTLEADDDSLYADGQDMTRLVLKIVDRYDNRLPYAFAAVQFDVHGTGANGEPLADFIGENPFVLVGGQGAVYLRARHQPGVVTVRARAGAFEASVTVTLR